ncbi:MAG: hypothetical protein ACI9J3_003201 [Parvicellaceae bacterium]|jgi:hypothetical protein
MSEWWSSVGAMEAVYFWVAVPATGLLAVLLILNFIGGDTDADADFDGELGFQFISLKNMTGFFAVYGWTGMVCIDAGLPNGWTLIIALIAGLAMMLFLGFLFYAMSKTVQSGTLIVSNSIGKIGETYLTIPPKRSGIGKVQIKVQGSLRELDAVTDSEVEIKTRTLIIVDDVISDEILLVKVNN